MRILQVTEDLPAPSPGGLARHVLTLSKELIKLGHQVDLMGNADVSVQTMEKDWVDGLGFIPGLGKRVGGWKERGMGMYNPWRRSYIARRMAAAVRGIAKGYDVVHYHGHAPNLAHYLPAAVPFIQTRHDQGGDCLMQIRFRDNAVCNELDPSACAACIAERPKPFQARVSAWAVRRFRREVRSGFARHKTIFVSELLRRNWQRIGGPEADTAVIHNFIDYASVRRMVEHTGFGSSDDRMRILVATKIYPPKGVQPFLETVADRLPGNAEVVIVGDGSQRKALEKRFVSEQIRFLGWQAYEETLRLCARADRVVVPSVCEESCATTVLEALALGRPTFALARGGTPELVKFERYPGQLQLFQDMDNLVEALVVSEPPPAPVRAASFGADVSILAEQILEVYSGIVRRPIIGGRTAS